MKVIIAGSRDIKDFQLLYRAVLNSGFDITEVVCGMAPGVDELGYRFAQEHKIRVKEMPAHWNDLKAPGAVIKQDRRGRPYNARAGYDRNQRMAEYADALICIHNGSAGSVDMLRRARMRRLPVHEVDTRQLGQGTLF